MKHRYLIFLVFLFPTVADSQNYFQQDVKFNIHVKLNDVNHELSAFESIEYTNNSPDTLKFLYFHLWPNGYKDNSTALAKQFLKTGKTFFYFSNDSLKGYIDSLDFKVNDKTIKWEFDPQNIDICKLLLTEPLKPGQTITITTPFHDKIPDYRMSRMGHDGQSYQISQWFPKPAVYDLNGWNEFPYLDQGEFYSEFGIFDVYITLPENYVVGATGDLVDGEKETAWLNNKVDETKKITKFDRKDLAFPLSSKQTKTLHYHQEKVHDFAWFADKRFHVLKGEVELPNSKRKVNTWVMFTNRNAQIWKDAVEYVSNAIYYYSKWVGEYPYNHATAVDGGLSAGGGMEYPNITVISSGGDAMSLEMVIVHEVGHNWFYGLLGSNERKNPWMDEGINSFYEYRYLQYKHPGSTMYLGKAKKLIHFSDHPERTERSILYEVASHLNNDQPIGLPAIQYSTTNYGGIIYEKTAITMAFLKDYLGEQKFDAAMQEYFNEWKFKHPQPKDIHNALEKSTGEKLGWFFDDMINSTKKLDYKVCRVVKSGDSLKLSIKNKGQVNAPFQLMLYNNNSWDISEWADGFKGKKETLILPKCESIRINSENNCPEYNRKNNYIKTTGIFKKSKPLHIQMLPGIDDPIKAQLCITPVAGYNYYNGFMLGAAFYNNPVPQKKFSYFLMPMYGTADNSIAGYSRAGFTFLPKWNKLQLIWFGASLSHYAYSDDPFKLEFTRIIPEILIKLKNNDHTSTVLSEIRFRNFNIRKDDFEYVLYGDSTHFTPSRISDNYYVNQLAFNLADKRKINPYSFSIVAEQGKAFLKASAEGSYRITYNKPRKGLDIRAFFGSFIYHDAYIKNDFRFRMDGLQGYNDYLFDHYYIGRNEGSGILSNQFNETDGEFKIYTPIGETWNWLGAINLKSSLPSKLPLKLFADIGIFPDKNNIYNSSLPIFYDAGIQVSIINNIFDIYFPLLMSKEIKDLNTLNKVKYSQTIRFTLALDKIDPFKLLRDIR